MTATAPAPAPRWRLATDDTETVVVAATADHAARAIFEVPVDVARDGTVTLAGSDLVLGRVVRTRTR